MRCADNSGLRLADTEKIAHPDRIQPAVGTADIRGLCNQSQRSLADTKQCQGSPAAAAGAYQQDFGAAVARHIGKTRHEILEHMLRAQPVGQNRTAASLDHQGTGLQRVAQHSMGIAVRGFGEPRSSNRAARRIIASQCNMTHRKHARTPAADRQCMKG